MPLALAGGLSVFVAFVVLGGSPALGADRIDQRLHETGGAGGTRGETPARDTVISREARRAAIEATSESGYLPQLLSEGERMITRWPERATVRVWVSPTSSMRGWHPRMVAAAREAFDDWRAVAPVEFRFVADSQDAQVIVTWRDRFEPDGQGSGLVGHARRFYTADGWITSAEVALAVHSMVGTPLEPALIRAAALHEVGHVLGLPHSDNPEDIMAPSHSGLVTRISLRDARTARSLYGFPPGPLRD